MATHMHVFQERRGSQTVTTRMQLALLLSLSILLWAVGAPFFLGDARAAQLTLVTDTLIDSDLSVATKHTIQFTATNAIYSGQTLRITLDPSGSTPFGNSGFVQAFSGATSSDIFWLDDGSAVTFTAVGNYNNGSNEYLELTLSSGTIATSSVVTVVVGSTTPLWTNPSAAGSRVIRIGGTMTNAGDTRVALLDDVVVTASVDSIFTFTVTGLATSSTANGVTTTGSSTPTALAFNTLTPNSSSTLAHELSVATNAQNGFSVTVYEDQNLTASNGADIDLFANGGASSTPGIWLAPESDLGLENTYGHFGITSEDTTLVGGDLFGTALFVGNFASTSPRQIFYHNGPADGTTADQGRTRVGYTIEIGNLQEAGTDYTNTLTYIATPVF